MTAQSPRSVNLPQAVALYLGAVVGSGVLIIPGTAASLAGPASIVAWIVDCLLSVPIALTFARLAAAFPDPGGVASFTRRAFDDDWGAAVGWFYLLASMAGQAIVTLTGGYYVATALGADRAFVFLLATGILGVATVANLRGLRVSATLQVGLSAAVIALLVLAVVVSSPRWQASSFVPFAPAGLPAIGSAAVLIFVAFFGWEAVAQLSAKFIDPSRDLVRATLATVALVTALCVGVAIATVATRTYGTPDVDRTAISQLLGASGGAPAAVATAVIALILTLGTCNAFVAASARLAYALARDRAFPSWFDQIDRGQPIRAIKAFAASVAAILALLFASGSGAESLLVIPSTLGLLAYVIGTAAGVRLLERGAKRLAAVSFVVTLALIPFAGLALGLPVALAAAAITCRRYLAARR